MTSYISKNEANNLQNGDIHFAQIPGHWNGISREPVGALRSVTANFFSLFALFQLSLTYFLSGMVL